MLNLFRRHIAKCSKSGTRSADCPSKPKCPIHFEGIDGTGKTHKPQRLLDPSSASGVRDWSRAVEIIRDLELPAPPEPLNKPKTSFEVAADLFLKFKSKKSVDTQRKIKLLLSRLQAFLERKHKSTIEEIRFEDLIEFRDSWADANTTQRRNQELLKAFFRFCADSDYIAKSPARKLDPIREMRPKTEPFELDEMRRIFAAIPNLPDEYGRRGTPIALQTKAFVLVMRYSGLSIGDVAKLEKVDVRGTRIRTHRKKTGEEVFAKVPQFVIDALNEAPHDSDRYFFWTGQGKIHTRTSKWGSRLQKLFVLANVKCETVARSKRVGGKLKPLAETVRISKAHPHMLRHTLVRDLLDRDNPASLEEISELLGNSMRTVEKYYSKWDRRRQARLETRLEQFWEEDPLTKSLNIPLGSITTSAVDPSNNARGNK
jgi:integrase